MSLRNSQLSLVVGALGFTALATVAGGCSETFGDRLREHRGCIGEAQIAPEKVDTCLQNTDGHRERVDVCLSGAMVPDRKIEILNQCVEEREHHENY